MNRSTRRHHHHHAHAHRQVLAVIAV